MRRPVQRPPTDVEQILFVDLWKRSPTNALAIYRDPPLEYVQRHRHRH